ncbi:glycosyltransferase family 4 protein [Candidatus Auribacterota bacterium]
MRITQVSMFYRGTVGGQETYVHSLDSLFKKSGFESNAVQIYRKGPKDKNVTMLPYCSAVNRIFPDAGWFLFNAGLAFCGKKLSGSDIIISHYPFHYPALSRHRKVVVVSHGIDWHAPPGSLADKHRMASALRCRRDKVPLVANDTDLLRFLGCDIEPGTRMFEEIDDNVWFIPNCVDTGVFCPDPSVRKEDVILVPRNICHARGIHLAIEAFRLFNKTHRDHRMRIVGGPTGGAYFEKCRELADKCVPGGKISFEGKMEHRDMKKEYRKAKITLIPSIEREGTSLSALESMACGTPVVSTLTGGLADLPTVKAETKPEDICSKLADTLSNYERVKKEQYDRVKASYDIKKWHDAWLSVINRLSS